MSLDSMRLLLQVPGIALKLNARIPEELLWFGKFLEYTNSSIDKVSFNNNQDSNGQNYGRIKIPDDLSTDPYFPNIKRLFEIPGGNNKGEYLGLILDTITNSFYFEFFVIIILLQMFTENHLSKKIHQGELDFLSSIIKKKESTLYTINEKTGEKIIQNSQLKAYFGDRLNPFEQFLVVESLFYYHFLLEKEEMISFQPEHLKEVYQKMQNGEDFEIGVIGRDAYSFDSHPNFWKIRPELSFKTNSLPAQSNRIFIVHGHDEEMKQSVARVLEKLSLEPIILHEQADLGRTVIEKFEDYSDVNFAIILLSPDDKGHPKEISSRQSKFRARQNVIFEWGFFLGKLERNRVLALHKNIDNFEFHSDIQGLLYLDYDDKGAWKLKLVKELKECQYKISADQLL